MTETPATTAPPALPQLRPATADELAQSLAFALRFDGRKRVHTGDEYMARITADRLIKHLLMSGYVIMKKPPVEGNSPARLK